MTTIYVVNRVISTKEGVIRKKAFSSLKKAKAYTKWVNKRVSKLPSWIEEIEFDDLDYNALF